MDELEDPWLSEDPLPDDPVAILKRWLAEAFAAGVQPNPHAIALATVGADGEPSVRMVLCNEIDDSGTLTFYTHYDSRKGRDLATCERAAAVFYWSGPSRQARVEGRVVRSAAGKSDAYYASRPLDARLGAWASAQSEPLASRTTLLERIDATARRFGVSQPDAPEDAVPRPPGWGGYELSADTIELWVSRPARVHDRAEWCRTSDSDVSVWTPTRLFP